MCSVLRFPTFPGLGEGLAISAHRFRLFMPTQSIHAIHMHHQPEGLGVENVEQCDVFVLCLRLFDHDFLLDFLLLFVYMFHTLLC